MKNFFTILFTVLFSISSLFGAGKYSVTLELARSAKVDKTIQNINELVSFTQEYILETGDITPTKEELSSYFKLSDSIWNNADNQKLTYTFAGDSVLFGHTFNDPDKVSALLRRFFKNSPNLPKNSIVDEKTLSVKVLLSSKTLSFITLVKSLQSKGISIDTACVANKPCYKPDGLGSIDVILNGQSLGKLSSDKDKIALVVDSKDKLDQIFAKNGDEAYVIKKDGKDSIAVKYVYGDGAWVSLGGDGGIKTAGVCNANNIGALKYDDNRKCMAYCLLEDGQYTWKCSDKNVKPPVIVSVKKGVDGVAKFDGKESYIDLGIKNNILANAQNVEITADVKLNDMGKKDQGSIIISQWDWSAKQNYRNWLFGFTNGNLHFSTNGIPWEVAYPYPYVGDNKFHTVKIKKDAKTTTISIDGKEVLSEETNSKTIQKGLKEHILIGAYENGDLGHFNGEIRNVTVKSQGKTLVKYNFMSDEPFKDQSSNGYDSKSYQVSIVKKQAYLVKGNVQPNAKIVIYDDNQELASAVADENGDFEVRVTKEFKPATTHNLYAKAVVDGVASKKVKVATIITGDKVGQAVKLSSASQDYIGVHIPKKDIGEEATFSATVSYDNVKSIDNIITFDKYPGSNPNKENAYTLKIKYGKFYDYYVYGTNYKGNRTFLGVDVSEYLTAKEPHNLTISYKSGDTKLYIDGNMVAKSDKTWSGDVLEDLVGLGRDYKSGSGYFDGLLLDVKVYKKALDEKDVQKLAEGKAVYDGLLADYDFEGSSLSQALKDKSGNGYNGKTYGSPMLVAAGSAPKKDSLNGSDELDVIYAGGDDDTITPKKGNDYIDGGDGYDTVVLDGKRSDYQLTKQSDGSYSLKKGDEVKTLVAVESLKFSDKVQELVKNPSILSAKAVAGGLDEFGVGRDYNSVMNNYGGFYNAPAYPHACEHIALKSDGSIRYLGTKGCTHGTGAGGITPVTKEKGMVEIIPNEIAYAGLKSNGSIVAWGFRHGGGEGYPKDKGYKKIVSSDEAFAALKDDGTIKAWGDSDFGGTKAPTDGGYVDIFSNERAFVGLKKDGSVVTWGGFAGVVTTPSDKGFKKIFSNRYFFAGLKADGTIKAWGDTYRTKSKKCTFAPSDKGYITISSTENAFAALKSDGSISVWGEKEYGGSGAPTDKGYVRIFANNHAFAALKADGSITAWGNSRYGGSGAPTDKGYVRIFSSEKAFTAIKEDGSVFSWGDKEYGGSGAPTDKGYVRIFSTSNIFIGVKEDGSIVSWGDDFYEKNVLLKITIDGKKANPNKGFIGVTTSQNGVTAIKDTSGLLEVNCKSVFDFSNNSGKVKLSGKAPKDSIVYIKEGDKVVATTKADNSGNFSVLLGDDVSMGVHTLYAVASVDDMISKPSKNFTLVKKPKTPKIEKVDANSISGSADKNSYIEVYDSYKKIATGYSDDQGKYNISFPSALQPGKHTIYVYALKDGVKSDKSKGYAYELSIEAPTLSTVTITGKGGAYRMLCNNGCKYDTTIGNVNLYSIAGKAPKNMKVYAFDGNNATSIAATGVDANGNFKLVIPGSSLKKAGTYHIVLKTSDNHNLSSASKEFTLTLKDSSLVAWYKFNEGSGYNGTKNEVKDSSGNGHHGEAYNYWGSWAKNVSGGVLGSRAVKFDYLGEIETHGVPDIVSDHDFTYSLWIKLSDVDGWGHILGRREGGNNDFEFMTIKGMPGSWVFRVGTTNGYEELKYQFASKYLNKWTLVTFVKNGNKMKLYINGSQVKEQQLSHKSKAWCGKNYPIRIGSRKGGYSGDGMKGYIDNVMIFNKALSDQEVVDLRNKF